MNFITIYEFMNFCYEFMTCGRSNIVCKLEFTTNLINFFAFITYDVARFGISHYLVFAWTFEWMQRYANAFPYLHVVFNRLHELAWHSNGSIKCQTLECHSNR